MTLKELIMKVEFDSLFPYLKIIESKHADSWSAYREAYDILRNMEAVDNERAGQALIEFNDESEYPTHRISIHWLDDNSWDVELAKELVMPEGIEVCNEELAAYCLWEITYYGFSPDENSFVERLNFKPQNKYEIALDKLEESIWKHQTPRKLRSRSPEGHRLTTWTPSDWGRGRKKMNRSKRKRQYRQEKREGYLRHMSRRENIIGEFTKKGSTIKREDVEFIFDVPYGVRYDYCSIIGHKGDKLTYIAESITRYQQIDLQEYDNAVFLIKMPFENPINEKELEAFETTLRAHFGYEDMLFGTLSEDFEGKTYCDAKVVLSLNKR